MPSTLIVVLDATQLGKDLRKQQKIKVGVKGAEGKVQSQIVMLVGDKLELKFAAEPKLALDVAVGPADASDENLFRLQTLTQRVLPTQWRDPAKLVLEPLPITPFFWAFWLRWCRNFVIQGRVVCQDGRPVPGAVVQAFDVDFLWWWWSRQQAGPNVVTDANGSFTINFRWCCGWLPIWWWRLRHWALEPQLAGRILPVLRLDDKLPPFPKPDPTPDLRIFSALMKPTINGAGSGLSALSRAAVFDPTLVGRVRESLLARLPKVPDLVKLRLWPWAPWTPWSDCTPDLIFRVTQNCGQGDQIIVSESVFDTRWDVPTNLNVTLTANSNACCTVQPEHPTGNCAVITKACETLIVDIEQNPLNALVGFANASDPTDDSDQAFGGVVTLRGVTGTGAGIDVYEIEHTTTPAVPASWAPVNPAVAGDFTRSYLDVAAGITITPRSFPATFTPVAGRNVVESLERFEASHPAPPGVLRLPIGGQDVLVNLLTDLNYSDGAHFFRLKAYTLGPGNTLINPRVLPLCDNTTPAGIALRLDNRFVDNTAPFGMPSPSPNQVCGPGTVHTCTVEPDVRIVVLRYNGVVIQPCDVIRTPARSLPGGPLVVDFFAHDPDGMLWNYGIEAHHGENLVSSLLSLPGASIVPLSPAGFSAAQVGGIPQADAQGPNYMAALTAPQSASRPFWRGGLMRLTIPNAHDAFPDTCAYNLQIDAFKRTIGDCHYWKPYRNSSEFSLTVIVGP